jgi:hypothetical protein
VLVMEGRLPVPPVRTGGAALALRGSSAAPVASSSASLCGAEGGSAERNDASMM